MYFQLNNNKKRYRVCILHIFRFKYNVIIVVIIIIIFFLFFLLLYNETNISCDESECNGDTKIMISTLRLLLLHLYTHVYS